MEDTYLTINSSDTRSLVEIPYWQPILAVILSSSSFFTLWNYFDLMLAEFEAIKSVLAGLSCAPCLIFCTYLLSSGAVFVTLFLVSLLEL